MSFTEQFKKLAETGNLSHAYIFYGEDLEVCLGAAKNLANFFEHGDFAAPETILEELLIVEPVEGDSIGIDEIRGLQKFLYFSPAAGKKRMAVVCPADGLTAQAQSAVLKIAEEPPADTLLVLIARHPDNLLPTVSSRLQKIYFPAAGGKKIKAKKSEVENSIDEVDEYFKKAISGLNKDAKKNSSVLSEVLKRYALFKQYNLNKKLQRKYLDGLLKKRT